MRACRAGGIEIFHRDVFEQGDDLLEISVVEIELGEPSIAGLESGESFRRLL